MMSCMPPTGVLLNSGERTATKARCSSSSISVSHHGGTPAALSTQKCRMENPPAGRANQDPRATSRCIIAVFCVEPAVARVLLAAHTTRVARFQPSCFLLLLLLQAKVNNALHDSASDRVESFTHTSQMVRWASPDHLAALNRRATARRDDGWCVVGGGVAAMVLPFVIVPSATESSAPGVVRLELESAATWSYHTRRSDMVWLECEIFRNMHSTSAAGQEQGLTLTASYHDYRLGRWAYRSPAVWAQAERQMRGCVAGRRPCVVSSPQWCPVERDTGDAHSALVAIAFARQHHRVSRRAPTIRSGPPEAAQHPPPHRRWCGLGEGGWATIDRTRHRRRQPTTGAPLFISFVQGMQPRTGPAVGEQI
jgi:hypothetical protein